MYVYLQQLLLLSFILIYHIFERALPYQSMLLGGGGCCMPNFSLLSSCIALSFHTTRKNYATLFDSFGRGLILYIYTFIFLSCKNIFYHPSLLYRSMLLGGGGCCMPNFPFIILHCSVSHTTRTNTLPLLTPLGGDWFYIHSYIHTFLSRIFSIILHVSPSPHF